MFEKYIELLKSNILTKDDVIFLGLLNEQSVIKITDLFENYHFLKIKKKSLIRMEKLELIKIDYQENSIINMKSKNINIVNNDKADADILTVKFMDEIRIIINREVKPYELEKLKKWTKYGQKSVKEAFLKAKLKGIDNFAYVEKILENGQVEDKNMIEGNSKGKITRNFDFFN